MSVSWRHTVTALSAATALSAGLAWAQGSGGMSGGHHVGVPGVTVGGGSTMGPSHGSYDNGGCCTAGKSHGVYVPGVNIAAPNIVVNTANVNVNQGFLSINQSSSLSVVQQQGFVDNRAGFFSSGAYIPLADGVPSSVIDGLDVSGAVETYTETVTEQVPVQKEVCIDRVSVVETLRAIQAVCLDDTGTPHPASRLDASQAVDAAFSGELFRCVPGSSLQVSLGSVIDGEANFSTAEGFSCAKGDALVHLPNGELTCAPQSDQRSCFERSLLRRHGPGIKVIHATQQKTFCEPTIETTYQTVQREVTKERALQNGPIVLDGGVGQAVY